ncbi:MAG: helix-turn-helix domain protein [Actinoallomurus sp.]|nr:helix-turn-helix domain protein [Actinoallomurus sp.]
MNSPLVRRKRLASEIRTLREAQGLNHEQLGKATGFHRLKISRLETGERPPIVTDVMKILTALGVEGDRWHELVRIAEDAAERGWWREFGDDMGPRQQVYADLEAGAASVRTYEIFAVPGLLQTSEYARWRGVQAAPGRPEDYVQRNVDAREVRQKMFHRPDGPEYEVILEELAIRRLSAPPDIMATQLRHLVDFATNAPRTTIRILAVDARIDGYEVSRSLFSLFAYPDPDDPLVAAVDTETTDLVLTKPDEISPYVRRLDRLRDAALPVQDSIEMIREITDVLSAENPKKRGRG